ncbi:hypothetical protein GYB59_20285 [bacterium]|nr:hypothetical protein [Planctomyces sp.]MBR9803879.1 hypothetical protein [bacterium]
MTQKDLDSAVAIATGEDLCEIQRRGFSVADPFEIDFDPEPNNLPPNIIDWDELELYHTTSLF